MHRTSGGAAACSASVKSVSEVLSSTHARVSNIETNHPAPSARVGGVIRTEGGGVGGRLSASHGFYHIVIGARFLNVLEAGNP